MVGWTKRQHVVDYLSVSRDNDLTTEVGRCRGVAVSCRIAIFYDNKQQSAQGECTRDGAS